MPWYVASLLANVAIIATEYLNRIGAGPSWIRVLPKTLPFIAAAQYGLFVAFSQAPSWLAGWAFFTVGNSIMRVAAVHAMAGHEVASWPHAALGIGVMMAGAFLVKEGLA